jgi:hypothetical protein
LLVEAWDPIEGLINLHWVLLRKDADIMLDAFFSSIDQMGTVAGSYTLGESLLHVLLLRVILKRSLTVSSWDTSIHNQGLRLIYL